MTELTTSDPLEQLPDGDERAKPLVEVRRQSAHVKELVEQSAAELSVVNNTIERVRERRQYLPAVETALEKGLAVEDKLQEASRELSVVNLALEREARDRDMLEHQFAAAIEQEQAARRASLHDVLTGLPNRTLFNDRLEHSIAQARRQGWTIAVMFMDLDDFKRINDSYGHDVGDTILQTIAQRLKESTRSGDTLGRQGGDEFLYLAMDLHAADNIALIAEKIAGEIQAPCNVSVNDCMVSPSVKASIGISIFPKDGATADVLLRSADKAMYRAKQTKSGYAFAE